MAENTAKSICRKMGEVTYVLRERTARAFDKTLEHGTLSASISGG
jgi:hypothetical protein